MRRLVCAFLVFVALLALASGALLQADNPNKIKHPDGELPKTLTKIKDTPLRVWVAYDKAQLYETGLLKSDRVTPNPALKYMQSFFVADARNEQDFHLLVTSEDGATVKDYVGWIPGRFLVKKREAVLDEDTDLTRKVLVVNKKESVDKDINEVRIRRAPTEKAEGQDEAQRLFTPMFVYGEADNFVLVGDASAFGMRSDKDAAAVVMGWLPKQRVEIWQTREALEWDHESTLEPKDRPHRLKNDERPAGKRRRTTRGKIYETPEMAKKALKDDSVPALFEEEEFQKDVLRPDQPDGGKETYPYPVSPRLAPNAPRFPLLQRIEKERSPIAGELFEVGGIGGLYDGKRQLLSSSEVVKLQSAVESVRTQSTRTDILFVIDDTESMDKWFPVVERTVKRITDLANDNKRHVRVAITFYNDTNGGNRDEDVVKTKRLVDVTRKGAEIAKWVKDHRPSSGGDAHEMVYRGILEGEEAAGFNPKARKLLIVLGDCGDISASARRKAREPGYMAKYNVKAIVERLVPEDLGKSTPTEFYAIQVIPSDDSEAAQDFKKQMEEIVSEHSKRLIAIRRKLDPRFDETKFRPLANYFDPSVRGGKNIEKELAAQYARLVEEEKDLELALNRVKKGQWMNTGLTPEMERQIDVELKRRNVNVTVAQLRASGGVQLFQKGYVWATTKDGLPQVRRRVLMNEAELKDLMRVLDELGTPEGDDISRHELIARIIDSQANDRSITDPEKRKKLALKDVMKKSLGLAFRNRLMNKSIEELKSGKGGKGTIQDSEYFALLYARDLLKDAFNKHVCDYTVEVVVRAGMRYRKYSRSGKGREEQRTFYLGNDKNVQWIWLDYEKEWP